MNLLFKYVFMFWVRISFWWVFEFVLNFVYLLLFLCLDEGWMVFLRFCCFGVVLVLFEELEDLLELFLLLEFLLFEWVFDELEVDFWCFWLFVDWGVCLFFLLMIFFFGVLIIIFFFLGVNFLIGWLCSCKK